MFAERLEERLARLERERQYPKALTALDRTNQRTPPPTRVPKACSTLLASAARSRALRAVRPSGALRQIRPAACYTLLEHALTPRPADDKEPYAAVAVR